MNGKGKCCDDYLVNFVIVLVEKGIFEKGREYEDKKRKMCGNAE